MEAFTLYAVQIGSTTIDQITSQNIDPGLQEMLVSGDSTINNEHVSVSSQVPIVTFSTTDIDAILAAGSATVNGYPIDEANDSNAVKLWFRKRGMGATYVAGSVHLRATVNLGVLVPVSLRASHGDTPAEIECALTVVSDSGANQPVYFELVADPSLSPAIASVFTVGPWWVNGTQYDDIQDFNLEFGINVATPSGSGVIYPTGAYIASRAPTMTCTMLQLGRLDEATGLGALGVVRSGVTRAFLRKKVLGAALVPDATAEHIKFDVAEGRISPQNINAAHQSDAMVGLVVTPTWNGSNDPIAYTADVAVSGA